jgi:site-specific DNA-methyltransferase (cytosine-N4-specific)
MQHRFVRPKDAAAYVTGWGAAYCGDSLDLLGQMPDASVNLVMTSPPFALQRQKKYGNREQAEYVDWLSAFAREAYRVLKDDGSFVLDIGGAYEKGTPARSLYNFRSLSASATTWASTSPRISIGTTPRSCRVRSSG